MLFDPFIDMWCFFKDVYWSTPNRRLLLLVCIVVSVVLAFLPEIVAAIR